MQQRAEDLLNSDYAKQHPFSQAEIDHLQSAEGFHDPQTSHSAIIAGNVELRPGETPHDALSRVIRHERVGHDGLQTLLGSKDSKAQKHWEGLTQRVPQAELDAIAAQDGYKHLTGDRNALAHEWFARQAEKSPHLLNKPGLLRDMREAFKGQLKKLSSYVKGTDESHLDADLHELLRLSRKSALKKSVPLSASTPADSSAPARQFSLPGKSSPLAATTPPTNAIGAPVPGPGGANANGPIVSAGGATPPQPVGPPSAATDIVSPTVLPVNPISAPSSTSKSPIIATGGNFGTRVTTNNASQANEKVESITPPVFNKTHAKSQPIPKGKGLNGGRMQSHHGLQQEWAIHNLAQHGYKQGKAPTITIETGTGLQHTIISNLQNARRDARKSAGKGPWSSTLQEELGYIASDLTAAGYSRNDILKTLDQQYRMLDKLGVPYNPINY